MKFINLSKNAICVTKEGFYLAPCSNGALGIFEKDSGQFVDYHLGPDEWKIKS